MLAGHSATLWEGNIYVWGGKTDRSAREMGMYSPHTLIMNPRECVTTGKARFRRLHVTGTGAGHGGLGGDGFGAAPAVPKGRAYHSAACYGRYLFITGGLMDESFGSAAEAAQHSAALPVLDLERRSWSIRTTFGDVPSPRCHHVSVVYGDTLMVHGGYPILDASRHELSPEEIAAMQHAMYDVHELHTLTLRWTRIHTTQSPSLWGHSAIVYNSDVIVFGGVDVVENAETGSVAVWSAGRQRWVWVDSQTLDLRCTMHTAVQEGGRMLVFGGVSFRTKSKLRTLYEFNLDFGSWRELHPQGEEPAGRMGHAAVVYQQSLFIIGGSVRAEGGGSSSGNGNGDGADTFERLVHVYHMPSNQWTACELSIVDDSEAAEAEGQRPASEAAAAAAAAPSWIAADDSRLAGAEQTAQEWRSTAGSIRETIARARAIQSLTSGAANALERTVAVGGGGGAMGGMASSSSHHLHSEMGQRLYHLDDAGASQHENTISNMPYGHGGGGGGGFGGYQQQQPNGYGDGRAPHAFEQSLAGGVHTPRHAGAAPPPERSFASGAAPPHQQQHHHQQPEGYGHPYEGHPQQQQQQHQHGSSAVNAQETWRMVDHLRAENEALRRSLEEFRSQSAAGGSARNPYEVPIYNSRAAPTLPPDGRAAPRGVQSLRSLTEIVVPRLNINVADPPRAVGNERSGHMSREAVTALINSSLRKDQPASASLASRLAARRGDASLDPMSYLHVTPNVARANATSGGLGGGGPLTYDQLLAKTAGGGYAPDGHGASAVPKTLQPLLSLLASSARGAPAPDYAPTPQTHAAMPMSVGAGGPNAAYPLREGGVGASFAGPPSAQADDRRPGPSGRASMLSMGLLRGSIA